MPNETPFGSLESLVGRTFEKNGERQRVLALDARGRRGRMLPPERPDVITELLHVAGWPPLRRTKCRRFCRWLSKAKEVTPS